MREHFGPPTRICLNAAVERSPDPGPAMLGGAGYADARRVISGWPGYAPTPHIALPGIARDAGVAAVDYKDEGRRFGLGSFKALGGAYAVHRIAERLRRDGQTDLARLTVTCATDGNHGRAVAWGARQVGCRCVIFVHPRVSVARVEAIRRLGAEVRRVAGNYDDSVRQAAHEAAVHGWSVVSDTSYEGYVDVPRDIMNGYMLLVDEALEQAGPARRPTHVFVQGGVGGLAGAVAGYLRQRYAGERPRLVVVEPDKADCLLRSCVAGKRTIVGGELDTIMAGLACGEPSLLAWALLHKTADAFMTIRDDDAVAGMRLLANPADGTPPVIAGESGAAGLAGFLAAAGDPASREDLGLAPDSVVLTIGTEADTDPEAYARLVGGTVGASTTP